MRVWSSLSCVRLVRSLPPPSTCNRRFFALNNNRLFHSSRIMSDLMLSLTAPNGRQYSQPIGLFINNEFVASKDGDKFGTISPAYVSPQPCSISKEG